MVLVGLSLGQVAVFAFLVTGCIVAVYSGWRSDSSILTIAGRSNPSICIFAVVLVTLLVGNLSFVVLSFLMLLLLFSSFLLLLLFLEVVLDDIDILSFGSKVLLRYLPALIFFRIPCCLAFASFVDDLPDCEEASEKCPIDGVLSH